MLIHSSLRSKYKLIPIIINIICFTGKRVKWLNKIHPFSCDHPDIFEKSIILSVLSRGKSWKN